MKNLDITPKDFTFKISNEWLHLYIFRVCNKSHFCHMFGHSGPPRFDVGDDGKYGVNGKVVVFPFVETLCAV